MKIYTKSGDKGTTSLLSGRRVSKADLTLEAYGTIDELNSFVGLLGSKINAEESKNELTKIQNLLFNIGSLLARDGVMMDDYPRIGAEDIQYLESQIDKLEETLKPLSNFILPGGHEFNALAHICRTVCRRAERRVVAVRQETEDYTLIVQFLNRLSDYFFVLARKITMQTGTQEMSWNPKV